MSKVAEARAEVVFSDFKPAYTAQQAMTEATRCLFCEDAPCTIACPTSIDVAQFIRKIVTGNVKGSARTIFNSNILGMSCARVCPVEVLCVGECVYSEMGVAPVQIGKLQRYVTDLAYAEDWTLFKAGEDTGQSVGLVGGGPASLAAAHELRRFGHEVTIYERREQLGGLNVTGIAPYKMQATTGEREADWVLSIGGVDVRTGISVGAGLGFDELESRHDAVFLGFGLGGDSHLNLPGEDAGNIEGAVAFIERMKLGEVDLDEVFHAVVIGGGNTAVDVVRELLGLGVERVTMVYRGTEAGMKGYTHEWKAAVQEGARAYWQTLPTAYVSSNGKVTDVKLVRVDDEKKPIEGTEHSVGCEFVLLATGQGKLGELVADLDGIEVKWGRVVVDEHGGTGRPGYFAGGDCISGGKEVVNAAAEGKKAAAAIHEYLKTSSLRGAS